MSDPKTRPVVLQANENSGVVTSTNTRNTFPRTSRLLTAKDYGVVFRKNTRLSDKYWTLLVYRAGSLPPRLGMAIAKKRAKRAVDRNRIKRIAREAFRYRQAHLPPVELVVMNRDAAVEADNKTLRAALDLLFLKLG